LAPARAGFAGAPAAGGLPFWGCGLSGFGAGLPLSLAAGAFLGVGFRLGLAAALAFGFGRAPPRFFFDEAIAIS
jgi:hypothetical protein